jgi:hypothetical protein
MKMSTNSDAGGTATLAYGNGRHRDAILWFESGQCHEFVNAMQEEHAKAEAEERKAERDLIHDETVPLMREIQELKAEVAELRKELRGSAVSPAVTDQ